MQYTVSRCSRQCVDFVTLALVSGINYLTKPGCQGRRISSQNRIQWPVRLSANRDLEVSNLGIERGQIRPDEIRNLGWSAAACSTGFA